MKVTTQKDRGEDSFADIILQAASRVVDLDERLLETMASEAAAESTALRMWRPFRGSCHCGAIQYIAFVTLPPPPPLSDPSLQNTKGHYG